MSMGSEGCASFMKKGRTFYMKKIQRNLRKSNSCSEVSMGTITWKYMYIRDEYSSQGKVRFFTCRGKLLTRNYRPHN